MNRKLLLSTNLQLDDQVFREAFASLRQFSGHRWLHVVWSVWSNHSSENQKEKFQYSLHVIALSLYNCVFHVKPTKKWRFRRKCWQMLSKVDMPLKHQEVTITTCPSKWTQSIVTNELTVISGNEFSFFTKSFSSDTDWVCKNLNETTLEQVNKADKYSLLKQTVEIQTIFRTYLQICLIYHIHILRGGIMRVPISI